MTIEEEVQTHAAELESLRARLGISSVVAYQNGTEDPDLVIVADFDVSRRGYADRYFEFMFGLQRIFSREVDLWEKHMFEAQSRRKQLRPVSLSVFRATA